MSSIPNPQHGPALALAELITEHPELPRLTWSMTSCGHLSGSKFDLPDVDAAARLFVAVLGGTPLVSRHVSARGVPQVSFRLWPVWRDVQVFITLGGPVVAESSLVPESGLPVAWRAAVAS